MKEWPYERTLSAHLLCLTGISIHDITYAEVTKFEESLVAEYLRHIHDFWKYVTEICLSNGDNGIEILRAFNHGEFDKAMVYDREMHIPRPNIPDPRRDDKIIKYCKQKYMKIHSAFE